MSPVPAGHIWALPTVGAAAGARRHIRVDGAALCNPTWELGTDEAVPHEHVMCRPACKRCLARTGGAE